MNGNWNCPTMFLVVRAWMENYESLAANQIYAGAPWWLSKLLRAKIYGILAGKMGTESGILAVARNL